MKDVVTILVVFVRDKFKMFVKIFENGWRSRDRQRAVQRRDRFSIRAVDDVYSCSSLRVECLNIVLFQPTRRSRIALQDGSKEGKRNTRSNVVVIRKRKHGNIPPVC